MNDKDLKCTSCNKKIDTSKINIIDVKEGTITCQDCLFNDHRLNE